jgi:malonate-semialdehyde dehydrogenase (acetylating)/methylmalonate-semialdehyde dehydrogenase
MSTTQTKSTQTKSNTPPTPVNNFIGGQWSRSATTNFLDVHDPATGELLARTPLSTSAELDNAVRAAAAAWPAWRATPAVERARVLFRLRQLLVEHKEELATLLSREHGKVLDDARGEIQRGTENVEHACGVPSLMLGDTLEDIARGIDCETFRQPLGVFGVITPYNFPVMIPLWFWPYAVATGNTVVLKPSEQDPLAHQRVVELAIEAGVPAGVLNVVHGGHEVVNALLDHPAVVGVSFVGSSSTAQHVYSRAAQSGKRVQALGGAKNHMIVLPDANLDHAIDAITASVFGAAGQRCLAGSVIVGVAAVYDELCARLVESAAALRLGRGLDSGTDMGPVISAAHRDRIRRYIDGGASDGAKLLLDGRTATVDDLPHGHWIGPTIFEGVTPEMPVGREEVFGPVAGLMAADSLESAVELVHRNSYGNAISLFTTSGKTAREFRYRAGISMIGINIGVVAPMALFPFGGSRASFYGDLKAQGRDAIAFYTDQRVVITRW